ncbi:MAG: hypothetical protein LBO09_03875 [Candidatus Peribacteria bacterium]|jgi:hypothetical protein|nr:hypothetical protein [Candidatus Peribacteria bacterium]
MNKVRDYLQYDSNKDINEIENFKATLQSVDAALSNARQFLVEYDEISTELDKIDWENIAPEIEKSH